VPLKIVDRSTHNVLVANHRKTSNVLHVFPDLDYLRSHLSYVKNVRQAASSARKWMRDVRDVHEQAPHLLAQTRPAEAAQHALRIANSATQTALASATDVFHNLDSIRI
jgi:hypothetical protein